MTNNIGNWIFFRICYWRKMNYPGM